MISPSSPLAVLIASLVVSASADSVPVDRAVPQNVVYLAAKLRASVKQAWISAIGSDDAAKLLSLLLQNKPELLLPLVASNGKSALMVAAKKGNQQLAEQLVELGADVNESTDTQGTPFMFAVLGNNQSLARWLIEQGADIDNVGSNGWTALTIAAAKGNVHLLQWLIGQGADTQVRDVYRFTPFLRAVDNGYVEAAAVLLSLVETDINARDELDNTALHHAVSASNEAMVTLLLEHNADPDLINQLGISPMKIAEQLAGESRVIIDALIAVQD